MVTPLPWLGHTPASAWLPLSPFVKNLLIFSPLLAIAAGVLYILERIESTRRAAGTPLASPEREPEDAPVRRPEIDHGAEQDRKSVV